MNCPEWSAALIEEAAGTGEDAALKAHLPGCAGCTAELAALRAMLAAAKQPVEEVDWQWREGSARRKARIPSLMTSRIAIAAAALVVVGAFLHLRAAPAPGSTASVEAPLFDPIEAWARNADPLTDELLDEDDDAPPEDDGADDSLFLDEGTDG